jgi:glutaredoxin-like protein NrdH
MKGGDMLDTLAYTEVEGARRGRELTVYALSTCGFCKRALEFLKSNGIPFRYIYMDLIPIEQKNEAKKELAELYKEQVSFPYAVIDGKETLVGFIEADWRASLLS